MGLIERGAGERFGLGLGYAGMGVPLLIMYKIIVYCSYPDLGIGQIKEGAGDMRLVYEGEGSGSKCYSYAIITYHLQMSFFFLNFPLNISKNQVRIYIYVHILPLKWRCLKKGLGEGSLGYKGGGGANFIAII